MYHHHSQQQGAQPFSNGPRPPHHQPPPNQHQNRPSTDMLSQTMGFQFPRPTQLPDELESALAIRGARDMDHRLIDHMNRPNQHANQGSGSGISQHGSYSSNSLTLTSDNQSGHQQGVDWSNYQPPTKLFASPPPSASNQSHRHQGPQQQPQSSHAGSSIPGWAIPSSDLPSSQARHPHGVGGDGQGLYTPESAGSILASFGLSNEDLEVLSHYPDDQLTPDTLPFILRDIQINKSGNQKTVASTSSSSFARSIHDMLLPPPSRSSPLPRSCSPEVPSLLTVTQTAGKVIDYGHASRSKEENSTRETFKREQLSGERTVKMYPSSSSSAPKAEKAERRQVRLEHAEPSKHGDQDYRRTSSGHRKINHSPGREFQPSTKSRNLDRDYRRDGPKPRPSSETRSEASSRRSVSSSSGRKLHSSGKKLPTPTMISDFSAVSPKVYPHTCSLCHIQCDQEKDWVDHNNTVNHTAACRELRTKYPDWKPNLPSDRYGGRPKDEPLPRSVSRSFSRSPIPSPPHSKHRVGAQAHRPHGRPYSPHHHPRHHHYTEHGHRLEHQHSGSHSPSHSHRTSSSFREQRPEKRDRESSGGSSRSGVKRPHDELTQRFTDTSRHPPFSKAGYGFKHGSWQSSTKTVKSGTKTVTKMTKLATAKAADTSAKPPPAKKKKKIMTAASQGSLVTHRLVYLAGIPKDASEQEVTDLVGSFGPINNVVLMPCSEEESQKGEGQKASVCMVKADDAQALANSTNLSIRDQQITASLAKKPEAEQSSDTNSKPAPRQDKGAAGEESGGEADQKTSDEKGVVLVTGLPESGWSESDIIKLFQPFGTPSDIILATSVGKVLVSVPDMETAQEIVKVHAFIPAKIKDAELKMIHFKQHIGMDTPVALYNLLMGSLDPLESPSPLGWGRLLVIRNVPDTPSASSEVQKLVQRFGTVIKTLVLNNMVICEMATASMARSVHRRFQKFPCIIQNNPLFFSRKRDPKANTQTKVLTAYLDSPEDTPANGKDSQTTAAAAAEEEETTHKENSESPSEGKEKDGEEEDEKMKSTEEMVGEDKALGENGSKADEIIKDEPTSIVSNSLAEADPETDVRENAGVESVTKTAEDAAEAGNDKTATGEERETSTEATIPKIPKVTQEMVNALLVECRTRTASRPDKPAASTGEEQGETQTETGGSEKAAEDAHEPKKHTEEEKKQEKERKEREARKEKEAREREKEARERERKERERKERAKREREREERARREREKREEERREWERKEKERRERKRAYGEASLGSRSSGRSDTYKQSSWKEEQYYNSEAEKSKTVEEEEEEFEDFPFNLSDFVTVDEVGDVADLPHSPSTAVSMETTEGGEDAPASVQQDTPQDTPMEGTEEAATSDTAATPEKSAEHVSECEAVPATAAETSDGLVSSDLTAGPVLTPAAASPSAAPQAASSCSQTHVPTCQPEAPDTTKTTAGTESAAETETETTPTVAVDSTPEVKPQAPNHSQTKEETVAVSNKPEEQEKMQGEEDKETRAPAAETEKHQRSENHTNTEEESVKTTANTEPDYSLPPFDSSNPVGMEFLVPKTGFFCKVCNRFFNGAKEAEINHCKTLKHYDNLQKYLQTRKR